MLVDIRQYETFWFLIAKGVHDLLINIDGALSEDFVNLSQIFGVFEEVRFFTYHPVLDGGHGEAPAEKNIFARLENHWMSRVTLVHKGLDRDFGGLPSILVWKWLEDMLRISSWIWPICSAVAPSIQQYIGSFQIFSQKIQNFHYLGSIYFESWCPLKLVIDANDFNQIIRIFIVKLLIKAESLISRHLRHRFEIFKWDNTSFFIENRRRAAQALNCLDRACVIITLVQEFRPRNYLFFSQFDLFAGGQFDDILLNFRSKIELIFSEFNIGKH